jgi:hypothetical protein
VAKIRYTYSTPDNPDHTILATVENAPQVIWNPKSDYGYTISLATTNISGGSIAEYSIISMVAKQSRKYRIQLQVCGYGATVSANVYSFIKTGSSTYGSAAIQTQGKAVSIVGVGEGTAVCEVEIYVNAGDTIHGGGSIGPTSGGSSIYGDNTHPRATALTFHIVD